MGRSLKYDPQEVDASAYRLSLTQAEVKRLEKLFCQRVRLDISSGWLQVKLGSCKLGDAQTYMLALHLQDLLLRPKHSGGGVSSVWSSLELENNFISDSGLSAVLDVCKRGHVHFKRMRLYRNRLTDSAGERLALLLQSQESVVEELHLSHNWFTQRSLVAICMAIAANPAYPRSQDGNFHTPCWVRLEHNLVDRPVEVLKMLRRDGKVRICDASDREHCSAQRCVNSEPGIGAPQVHLYVVDRQDGMKEPYDVVAVRAHIRALRRHGLTSICPLTDEVGQTPVVHCNRQKPLAAELVPENTITRPQYPLHCQNGLPQQQPRWRAKATVSVSTAPAKESPRDEPHENRLGAVTLTYTRFVMLSVRESMELQHANSSVHTRQRKGNGHNSLVSIDDAASVRHVAPERSRTHKPVLLGRPHRVRSVDTKAEEGTQGFWDRAELKEALQGALSSYGRPNAAAGWLPPPPSPREPAAAAIAEKMLGNDVQAYRGHMSAGDGTWLSVSAPGQTTLHAMSIYRSMCVPSWSPWVGSSLSTTSLRCFASKDEAASPPSSRRLSADATPFSPEAAHSSCPWRSHEANPFTPPGIAASGVGSGDGTRLTSGSKFLAATTPPPISPPRVVTAAESRQDVESPLEDAYAQCGAEAVGPPDVVTYGSESGKKKTGWNKMDLSSLDSNTDASATAPTSMSDTTRRVEELAREVCQLRTEVSKEASRSKSAAGEAASLSAALLDFVKMLPEEPSQFWSAVKLVATVGWENVQWKRNFTGLHLAAHMGRTDSISLLLALRADPTKKDSKQRTALDVARAQRHEDFAEVLAKFLVP